MEGSGRHQGVRSTFSIARIRSGGMHTSCDLFSRYSLLILVYLLTMPERQVGIELRN